MQEGTGQKLAVVRHWSHVEPVEGLRNSWGQSASQPGGVQQGFLERWSSRREERLLGSRETEAKGEQAFQGCCAGQGECH